MNINRIIWQNLKKNIRSYYLYILALVFSVALCFSFMTLQHDPVTDESLSTVKGSAGISAGFILLIIIVSIFLLYANNLFIKRRSQEIGLFQLIGMTKGKIFRILSLENIILYIGSIIIGIFLGFIGSKIIKMMFFKITGIDEVAALHFSGKAMFRTFLVFLLIYLFIMLMNYLYIRRQSVLSLFQAKYNMEGAIKKLSVVQVLIGILGIILISFGYYLSTFLFDNDTLDVSTLFIFMIIILGSVIIGTYLFYKGSVSFILHFIRKSKDGYLSINNVLSLSSIMFHMRSNALLLTVITTVSALAIGLLSLTYISYYSAEKTARQIAPNDFSIMGENEADSFMKELNASQIKYKKTEISFITISANITNALKFNPTNFQGDLKSTEMEVISDKSVTDIDVSPDQAVLTGFNDAISQVIAFKNEGDINLSNTTDTFDVHYKNPKEMFILPDIASVGFTVAVINDDVYQQLARNLDSDIQGDFESKYFGIDITDNNQLDQANDVFQDWYDEAGNPAYSYFETVDEQKQASGLIMFIVGFLGLTFLITSGCIIYFKQMDESEEERPVYTIMRKIGFTEKDLIRGIWYKQFFNFGIPLVLGLLHSYFAVKSVWFIFGTEMITPTIIVMIIYTILYSIFGILSVVYYKRVIHNSL